MSSVQICIRRWLDLGLAGAVKYLESNGKDQMPHSAPLLLPHPQELSVPAAALTLLLLRTRRKHRIEYKGKISIVNEAWEQDSPWPQRGAVASDTNSLAVDK